MEPLIGQIIMFTGNFAPRGWALCDGQLLPIAQNAALFSILGTTYGGDGVQTFALPDLRGRLAMHAGRGPGLSPRTLGQKGGEETVTLTTAQMPSHGHTMNGNDQSPTSEKPTGNSLGASNIYDGAAPGETMHGGSVGNTGGGQGHDNMSPFLSVNFIIALVGLFPSRN